MSLISSEIQQRIITAAEQLHAEHPERLPTVAEVRSASKADMNSVSIVMKQWRQSKLMPVQRIEEDAPNEIQVTAKELTSKIWSVAKEQAEQKLRDAEQKFNDERKELEELRLELANECDRLNAEFEQITQLKDHAVKAQNDAEMSLNQALQQIEQLKSELQQSQQSKLVEIAKNKELEQHISTLKSQLNERDADLKALKSEHSQQLEQRNQELNTLKSQLNERDSVIDGLKAKLETLIQSNHEKDKALIELHGQLKVAEATATQAQHHAKDLKDLLDKQVKTAPVTKPGAKKDVSQNKDNNNE